MGIFSKRGRQLADVYAMRRRHVTPIDQPLVLVSQVQRSGGTLMSQLFAGHPELHVHPGELHIGYPKKDFWPTLDLDASPDRWFRQLFERRLREYSREGYVKVPDRLRANYRSSEIVHPFLFVPSLQRDIFRDCVKDGVDKQRDVIDAYMTSYFNAWLDYQSLYGERRKLVAAFCPRLASRPESVAGFFGDYPDGRLISIVRDPRSWYVSYSRKGNKRWRRRGQMLDHWIRSARAMLENRRRYGDRVLLLRFEDLLGDTEGTMGAVCDWLGIGFDPILTRPTFQGLDVRANSTFHVPRAGILDDPARRAAELGGRERRYVERQTDALYREVLEVLDRSRRPAAPQPLAAAAFPSVAG